MKLSKRAHQTIIVLLVFGGFIGLMFLSGFVPSTEQRCKTTCSKTGLDSRMVYKGTSVNPLWHQREGASRAPTMRVLVF